MARRQPLLITFEDIHWIDPTSRELLDLIAARIDQLPLLLVATRRPEFQRPWTGKTIGGVPQVIYKLPIDKTVSKELADIDFTAMFDRLIIGPSSQPWVMCEAFTRALTKAGIADADARVLKSGIPIRSL